MIVPVVSICSQSCQGCHLRSGLCRTAGGTEHLLGKSNTCAIVLTSVFHHIPTDFLMKALKGLLILYSSRHSRVHV